MELKDLSPEQRERIDTCNSPSEILELAKEEGYELSESELDQVSGGWDMYGTQCPECKANIPLKSYQSQEVTCPHCGHSYTLIVTK